jgi:site-specific recombinase XerD
MWAKETEIASRGIYQARLDMAKFVTLIEHDDATRVTPQDIVRFKEHLGKKDLTAPTINRYLSAIKSPLGWAKDNHKIATNPGLGSKYDSKGGAKKRVRRLGYDDIRRASSCRRYVAKTSPIVVGFHGHVLLQVVVWMRLLVAIPVT